MVFVVVEFITQFDLRIETEPGFSFGEDQGAIEPPVVGTEIARHLENAFVFQQVFVIFSVYDRNPGFKLRLPVFVQQDRHGQRHPVPTARQRAVFSVRLVLQHQVTFPDVFVAIDNQMSQPDAGVEVQVVHRERLLEHVPEGFLGVLDKQVRIEGELAFRQPLGDAQLKFHVGIFRSGFMPEGRSADKIIVFK